MIPARAAAARNTSIATEKWMRSVFRALLKKAGLAYARPAFVFRTSNPYRKPLHAPLPFVMPVSAGSRLTLARIPNIQATEATRFPDRQPDDKKRSRAVRTGTGQRPPEATLSHRTRFKAHVYRAIRIYALCRSPSFRHFRLPGIKFLSGRKRYKLRNARSVAQVASGGYKNSEREHVRRIEAHHCQYP